LFAVGSLKRSTKFHVDVKFLNITFGTQALGLRPLKQALSRTLRALDNRADDENPLFVRRKAPHNKRIEQMPFGHSSSARLYTNSFTNLGGKMEKFEETIRRFVTFFKQRNLPRAILKDIPHIGNTLESLIFDDQTQLLFEITKKTHEKLEEALPYLEKLMKKNAGEDESILVIGSGVAENVLTTESKIKMDQKHIVKRFELLGGSGLNYTFRLAQTGHPAFPILSVGKDALGLKIQKEVSEASASQCLGQAVSDFVDKPNFLCDQLHTPQTTIVVSGDQRTIFTEEMEGVQFFKKFVDSRMKKLNKYSKSIRAVMIGHIYADNPDLNPTEKGSTTIEIIKKYRNRGTLIFANFGESQLSCGRDFWIKNNMTDVDIFQFSLNEVRRFFAKEERVPTLPEIIAWFRQNSITAVITLEKFGAIATFKNGKDGIIFGWPFELDRVVDSTGAGDAFGAGLVSTLYKKGSIEFHDFVGAVKRARVWAAYACTTLGGSNDCPDITELQEFEKKLEEEEREFGTVEIQNMTNADFILRLLDKAY